MKIENLIRDANEFAHIFKLDESIFVANQFGDLTAFCVPSLRHRGGDTLQINYELGVVVLPAADERAGAFVECIESGRYVCLPRNIRVENALESVVRDGRISDWLLSDMRDQMEIYTLPKSEAMAMIETRDSFYLEKFRRVYQEKFDDWILTPLAKSS